MNVTRLLEDDCAPTRIHRLNVKVSEPGCLRQFFRSGVIGPDIGHTVAIGDEVDGVADPHRVHVLRVGPGRRNEIVTLEIYDPDGAVLAATIVAAFFVPGIVHAIGNSSSVRGNLSLVTARQRHRLFDSTIDGNGPESGRPTGRPGGAR